MESDDLSGPTLGESKSCAVYLVWRGGISVKNFFLQIHHMGIMLMQTRVHSVESQTPPASG